MANNVVLICLDCVRKDRYDKLASRLGDRADIQFEQCRAASSWSAPSHASMFTGRLPHQHGVHSYDYDYTKISREDTFLSELSGHETLGVSANPFASSAYGFDQLFDVWQDVRPEIPFSDGMKVKQFTWERETEGLELYREFVREALPHDKPIKSLGNGVISKFRGKAPSLPVPRFRDDGGKNICKQSKRLIRDSEEPFFLFTNFMDAHGPYTQIFGHDTSVYDAPNDWSSNDFDKVGTNLEGGLTDETHTSHYRGVYHADIEYLDRLITQFVTDVQELTESPTVFVVTADHGQNLAYEREDNLIAHMGTLSEGALHVPLDIIVPWGSDSRVIEDYVSHLDLGELLRGLAEGEIPDVTTSHPRAEIIGAAGAQGRLSPSDDEYDYWTRGQRCVYSGSEKYWWDSLGDSIVFELDEDQPNREWETGRQFDVTEFESKWFDRDLVDVKRDVEGQVNQQTSARLKDLGYL